MDSLYGIGEVLKFKYKDSEDIEGEIIGVNHQGKLVLKLMNLNIHEFDIKEITFMFQGLDKKK